MSGWQLLIYGGICFWGALMFLRFTVAGIEVSTQALDVLAELERKAQRRRLDSSKGSRVSDSQAAA